MRIIGLIIKKSFLRGLDFKSNQKMGKEIERKFLVKQSIWNELEKPEGNHFRQGYLIAETDRSVRVRLTNTRAFITIKGKTNGATRPEYEYEIPQKDAEELLNHFTIAELSKVRYNINYRGKLWEVDVFLGRNQGLIVAEIELKSEDESFEKPDWAGKEVTEDARYYNANLVLNPYLDWG